jgi:hypothetical protein
MSKTVVVRRREKKGNLGSFVAIRVCIERREVSLSRVRGGEMGKDYQSIPGFATDKLHRVLVVCRLLLEESQT